jgi:ADP-heptose:LPS heptosyltransferase
MRRKTSWQWIESMRGLNWENYRRVVVVRLDNIGDVIMIGPALRALKKALPGIHITLMASPAGSQVAPLLPWVDDVLVDRVVWQDASWTMPFDPEREFERIETLRAHQFDAAIIFTSFSQSPFPPAYACYLAGIPVRIGQSKEFGGSVLSHWKRAVPDSTHQVDRNLSLLEDTGLPLEGRHLELHVPGEIQVRADDLLNSVGVDPQAPFVILAPGASCAARRYDPQRFSEVSSLLFAETGLPILLVGSDRERELVQPFMALRRPVLSLVGRTSVAEMAGVIRRSSLVLANDSAPMHIADAFLRPMVVLYSGTELEEQWKPRCAPNRLLRRPTSCSPCYNFRCPYGMECLDIPAEEVAAEAVRMWMVSIENNTTQMRPMQPAI